MNTDTKIVRVADFTTIPGARYKSDGDGSAEEFFLGRLEPALDSSKDNSVTIDFDSTWGYASSFISELAIRLVKKYGNKEKVHSLIDVKTEDEPGLEHRFWAEVDEAHVDKES